MSPSARVAFRSCRFDLTKMLLGLICLVSALILMPASTQAQAQSPPGWSLTITSDNGYVGSATGNGIPTHPAPPWSNLSSIPGTAAITLYSTGIGNGNGGGPGSPSSVNANLQITFTVTGTWNGPGAAPASVTLLETSAANYGGIGPNSATITEMGSANDGLNNGLGDPIVATSATGGSSSGKHLIVAAVNGGQFVLTRTLSAVSNCTVTYTVPGGMSSSVGLGNYSVSQDSREVTISCPNIDTPATYYKGAYDPAHGTDRYVHQRDLATGAMSADSIVFLQNDPIAGQTFIASSTYNANPTNFRLPIYTWAVTGDGKPDSNTAAELSPSPTNPYGLASLPAYLNFGPTWDATKTKSNAFLVSVKDTDGASGSNVYNLTWHAPQENFVLLSYQHNVPQLAGSLQPIVRNETISQYVTIPGQEGQIDWGDVQQQSGLPVAVTGAGIGSLLLIPEIAAGPGGWAIVAAQAVAAGASYKLGTASPTHPGTIQLQGTADYNEYLNDLQHQVTINTNPNAADDLVRFLPTALAAQALAASLPLAEWGSDPYFMNSTAMWQGGWYTDIKDLQGDAYDVHGYIGHVPGQTTVAMTPFRYFQWTCNYHPQPGH